MILPIHTEFLIAGISILAFFILSLYYVISYARPMRMAARGRCLENNQRPPVSIILYAKNAAENLQKHLPALLSQDYPEYEVIVVNDGSDDETDDVLKRFQNSHNNLYHTYVPADARYLSRRKLALTLGIKAAKHPYLLFTEANCQPASNQWITSMIAPYASGISIVLGFCRYDSGKGLSAKLIAYDNLLSGLRYLSAALAHRPYTGDGRNLSYRKDLFFSHKGFYKSLSLRCGDDDLFINEAATPSNTKVAYTPESLTEMDPISLKQWMATKAARTTTRHYYRGYTPALYGMETFFFFLFQAASISTIAYCLPAHPWIAGAGAAVYALRYTIKAFVIRKSAQMLQQRPHLGWLFLLEFLLPLFNGYFSLRRLSGHTREHTFRLDK